MKRVIVIGGGGFIGGHLAKRLKEEGNHVTICDIKMHSYFEQNEICDKFILVDLTDPKKVALAIKEDVDELYQLATDMGGALYISTGKNDANLMHNSAIINLNVLKECVNKKVKKVFFPSSAAVYPENSPSCEESSAYPANPNSEYGWEKLFSERLLLAYNRNYDLNVKIARFHNIFGPQDTWKGGREKSLAAMCRKVAEAKDGDAIEVWGSGQQARSFLYVEECIEAIIKLMTSDFTGPVNIGSEEMVTINEVAETIIKVSGKNLSIKNIEGEEFVVKYGFECPLGVKGRRSDNTLYREKIGWEVNQSLSIGLAKTYSWIEAQVQNK